MSVCIFIVRKPFLGVKCFCLLYGIIQTKVSEMSEGGV